jgi:hypothetical protein
MTEGKRQALQHKEKTGLFDRPAFSAFYAFNT